MTDDRGKFASRWWSLILALPQLAIILTFFYWPSLQALFWSVSLERPFGGGASFIGLDNFAALLRDAEFRRSIGLSLIFTGLSSVLAVSGGLLLAVAVRHVGRGGKLFRNILIWPQAIAAPVVGVTLHFLANPVYGPMALLNRIWPGLWQPATDGVAAMAMVVAGYVYLSISFNFVILFAGLQSIPQDCLEAAMLDGAGPLRRFRDIELPLLTPSLFFALVMEVGGSFTQSFGLVDTLTHGGPGGATNILVYKIYSDGFLGLDLSKSSAESVILMGFLILMTVLQFRFLERRVSYGA